MMNILFDKEMLRPRDIYLNISKDALAAYNALKSPESQGSSFVEADQGIKNSLQTAGNIIENAIKASQAAERYKTP